MPPPASWPPDARARLAGLAVAAASLALYLAGLTQVPFHPDESTYLFMSRDFTTVFLRHEAASLAWSADAPLTPESRYRLLDAPGPRYLLGLGAWAAGYPAAPNQDWRWELSGPANQAEGRVPAPGLLQAARLPMTVLAALTTTLIYLLGHALGGPVTGLLAAGLLALHPLMLLHARRAMAESPLLFTSALAMLGALALARAADEAAFDSRWKLTGAALGVGALVGLAAASKHSGAILAAAALAPAGLALAFKPWRPGRRLGALAVVSLAAALGAVLVFAALNPVLWRDPAGALRQMAALRTELVHDQAEQMRRLAPHLILAGPLDRVRALMMQLFLQPPAVWDVAVADHLGLLRPQAETYFAAPLNRGPSALGGAALAGLATAGAAFSALRLARDRLGPATRGEQALWMWTLALLAFTLAAIPFDWQRYFLPLLPPVCLFAALGAQALAAPLLRRLFLSPGKRHESTP